MNKPWMSIAVGVWLAVISLASCQSLKPGECKRDNDCEGQIKSEGKPVVAVCYKEPREAQMGKCLAAKEARDALDRYERKRTGKCEDKDQDGVKAGSGCDAPVDCDDDDPAVKPGAPELCDSKDNNCDGRINEDLPHCVGTVLGGKQAPVAQFMTTMTAGVRVAANREVWVSDQHQIYRIGVNGVAQRMAGSEKPGNDDKPAGQAKFARFDEPRGMAVAADGAVYITECRNNCVRRLGSDGEVSVYAGKCSGESDDTGLDQVGKAEDARFWCPIDITFDKDGSLLVVDMYNSKIKRISKDRQVTLVAGKGGRMEDGGVVFGMSNGPALKAEFNKPSGIAVAADGAIYIADMDNNCIRVLRNGTVGTFAGKCLPGSQKGGYKDGAAANAQFKQPNSVDMAPDGSVVVADTANHCIRSVKNGQVLTLSGKCGQQGYYDGPLADALYNGPQSISVAQDGSMYVVDLGNYRVRKIIP